MSVHNPTHPIRHDRHRRLTWLPTSRMGWWALACAVTAPLVLLIPNMVFGPGPDHPESVAGALAGFTLAIAAPVITAIAAARRSERSIILIALCALLTLFVLAFVIGELFVEGR